MKIATFAALAFGTIVSAIPSPIVETGALVAREAEAAQDISTILNNLNNDLKEPLGALSTPPFPVVLSYSDMSPDGMTAATATADNVNTHVQQAKTLLQTATTAIGKARGNGNGNPLMLVGTTMNVRFEFSLLYAIRF